MPIPLQDQVDMSDRVQAIKVGLVAAGGVMFPSEEKLEEIAEHLAKFGCTWQPGLQTIWYRPPREGASWLEQTRGQWVQGEAPGVPPAGAAGAPSEIESIVEQIPPEMREEMIRALGGDPGGRQAEPDAGRSD